MKTSPGDRRRLGFEQTKVVSVALGFSLRRDETWWKAVLATKNIKSTIEWKQKNVVTNRQLAIVGKINYRLSQKKFLKETKMIIGPESDHCLPLSLTHSLTNSLTHSLTP